MTNSEQLTLEQIASGREMRGLLAPGARKAYCLAGHAIFTARSLSTGQRFTYKVVKADGPGELWFVRLLSGPDNEGDYQYVGVVKRHWQAGHLEFALTGKSRAGREAPSVRAISWLVRNWEDARAEVWHEGSCGRCGRRLTVPESIASGIGPTCATK